MFQARTNYLVLIAAFGFLALYRRSEHRQRGFHRLHVADAARCWSASSGCSSRGRLGTSFQLRLPGRAFPCDLRHLRHVGAGRVLGVSRPRASAERLGWSDSTSSSAWRQDPFSLLLGLGYGVALDRLSTGSSGAAVREPHNCLRLSIIARHRDSSARSAGCCIDAEPCVRRWHQTFMMSRAVGWREGENRLLVPDDLLHRDVGAGRSAEDG